MSKTLKILRILKIIEAVTLTIFLYLPWCFMSLGFGFFPLKEFIFMETIGLCIFFYFQLLITMAKPDQWKIGLLFLTSLGLVISYLYFLYGPHYFENVRRGSKGVIVWSYIFYFINFFLIGYLLEMFFQNKFYHLSFESFLKTQLGTKRLIILVIIFSVLTYKYHVSSMRAWREDLKKFVNLSDVKIISGRSFH